MDSHAKEPLQKSSVKSRRRILSLIAISSVALTLLTFLWLRAEERQFIQTDFTRVAEGRLASLSLAIEQKLLKLRSLAVVHQSLGKIERKRFPEIIQNLDFDTERIRSIGWLPKVPGAHRLTFEKQMQSETGKHFHLYQRGPGGTFKIAEQRTVHYPVTLRFPGAENQGLGFDVASEPLLLKTLNRAREEKSLSFGIVPFYSEAEEGISLLAVYPVFIDPGRMTPHAHAKEILEGFYFLLAPVGSIYQNVREQLPPVGIDVYIFAAYKGRSESLQILFSPSRTSTDSTPDSQTEASLRQGYYFEQRYFLGPDMPEIVYVLKPTDTFIANRQTWRPWAALLGGGAFSVALILFGVLQFRHTGLIHHFAEEQRHYAVVLEREVEERKLAEDRLKISNLELEAFVYTVSHDLRTPLSAIIGHAELLQMLESESLNNQTLDSLHAIEEQGRRMNGLMEDLLELARVGRLEPPAEEVNTNSVLQTVLEGLGQLIMSKNATLDVADMPPLKVPRSLLAQIFENLIGNALRYGCQSGGLVEVGCELTPETVRIRVSDHGAGIPAEEQEKIFEVFYRGSTGHSERGTGIGLATVKKIAQQYGGDVWYEDTPGGGATFFVQIAQPFPATDEPKKTTG
jgi:signal transduction histidine kinase